MAAAYRRSGGGANGKWIEAPILGEVEGLLHGFSTRAAGDFAAPAARGPLLEETGATELLLLRQVHGAGVAAPGPCDPPRPSDRRPRADAWAGAPGPGVLLGILTADCVPVLLCHPAARALGLAHAGWRGAVAGVAEAALKAMGVPAEETRAALGPAIGPCCYQVGEEVARAAGTGRVSPWPGAPGRYRLDLPGLVRDRLVAAGVPPRGVEVLPWCTACRGDLFFSHRRRGEGERMCAFLGWVPDRGEG